MKKQVIDISVSELHPFQNHPFYVRDDESMQTLCDSIREYGVLSPLLARPIGEGYELVSGHRRRAAAMKLGLDKLPVLVRDMTDDEAVILMVDSNIQRENLLPSEKAFAYKMKLEAIKHQGKATSVQFAPKLSTELIGQANGISKDVVKRYIRLTYLAKPLLDLVDEGRISFSPGVELSYLTKLEQAELWDIVTSEDCTPSLSQAVRLKKLSQKGELNAERIFEIMSEEKANQKERVRIEVSQIRKYFPKGYTSHQMEEKILQMLESNYKKHQRNQDAEFLYTKNEYIQKTGRVRGDDNVIAYHLRQSFLPGEITPDEANRLGCELVRRLTKGNNAYIVCTHIDRHHIHNHIIWNSTNLDATRKFRNFWGSARAVRRLSDTICLENGYPGRGLFS